MGKAPCAALALLLAAAALVGQLAAVGRHVRRAPPATLAQQATGRRAGREVLTRTSEFHNRDQREQKQVGGGSLPAPKLPLQTTWQQVVAAAGAAAAAGVPTSPFFGSSGESWAPDGPFMDYSYAGYRNGKVPIPTPPPTMSVYQFKAGNMSNSAAMLAAVAWANQQPEEAGWVVITLPPGTFTLDQPLYFTRPKTVLRGAGSDLTTLYLPYSLMELLGPTAKSRNGHYVFSGAFLTAVGSIGRTMLAGVVAPAARGGYTVQVNTTSELEVGQLVALTYRGGNGSLSQEVMNGKLPASSKFSDKAISYSSRIVSIDGNFVTLERALPYAVKRAFEPIIELLEPAVHDVGIEGFTMRFKWQQYGGHHLEAGYNGIELSKVQDCWVRDVHFINADSGVLVSGSDRVTVQGLDVSVTKGRQGGPEGDIDGHWGARVGIGTDVLFQNFAIHSLMLHGVGTDNQALFCVFEDGRITDGNLEMHRGQTAQVLFTDIHLGRSSWGFYSGGPLPAGPNVGAWTTFWNVRSDSGMHRPPQHNHGGEPGACSFGPDLTFVGVTFTGDICADWNYQPGSIYPPNLFRAQLQRRHGLAQLAIEAAGAAAVL